MRCLVGILSMSATSAVYTAGGPISLRTWLQADIFGIGGDGTVFHHIARDAYVANGCFSTYSQSGQVCITYILIISLLLVTVLGDDGFAVGINEWSKTSAVAAMNEEIVDAGFLVNNYDSVGSETDALSFFDIKSVFCHIRYTVNLNYENLFFKNAFAFPKDFLGVLPIR